MQVLPGGDTPATQAQAAVAELRRLSERATGWDWSRCAGIARTWVHLDPVRSLCEMEGIPVQMANEEFSGLWFLRETRALVDWLRGRSSRLVSNADLLAWLAVQTSNAWTQVLQEWLAEWGREVRRHQRGLLLLTAHRAKGLEFDHVVVLDGDWVSVGRD